MMDDADYRSLANFRYALRQFTAFTKERVEAAGLTVQQHQALLALCAAPTDEATVGYLAERLLLQTHSASGLVNRMVRAGLLVREQSTTDGRRTTLTLTPRAHELLAGLSETNLEEIRRIRPLLISILQEIG